MSASTPTDTDEGPFDPSTDDLVANNAAFAAGSHDPSLQSRPTRKLAVVACMDARLDTYQILGLRNGEAHVIRNAGGVVTDDVIRSLCLSQRVLGTREIVLLHHTQCGLEKLSEDDFNADLEAELGVKPPWSLESFGDAHADVRQSIKRLHLSPFVPFTEHVRGFVYDVATGQINEVEYDTGS